MVDSARALLDELMGRNRNLDPNKAKIAKLNWEDSEFCQYYLVKFCPHDLFVNTRADLGQCPKLHDDEAKRLFSEESRPGVRKRNYEDEFLRFCSNMINEVDRKIQKGKQRLLLMNKNGETGNGVPVSKHQEQVNILNDRIKKLVGEAEEAGIRGDVEQAQGLMTLCDKLKEEKEALILLKDSHWSVELAQAQEKQMEVCEVCGAFLIVGDAQQRIDDHLTGKQHLGYSRLRKAVEDMYESRRKEREDEEKRREDERKHRADNGIDRNRRGMDDRQRRPREEFEDRRKRDDRERIDIRDRRGGDRNRERDFRGNDKERRERGGDRCGDRERDRDKERHRHRNDRDSKNRSRSRSHTQ